MKREIKFRGKALVNGGWLYGDLLHCNGGTYIFRKAFSGYKKFAVDPATVGQYTGLKEKNGKEIYEGDIISVNGKINKLIEYRSDHAAFCMANIDDLGKDFIYPWQEINPTWWNDFKREILVIGNIHDNPELLNPEK